MAQRALSADELADHFGYLDMLRESGATNMFGAASYLIRDQGVSRKDASAILSMWMKSFSRETSPVERARAALSRATASDAGESR